MQLHLNHECGIEFLIKLEFNFIQKDIVLNLCLTYLDISSHLQNIAQIFAHNENNT